VSFISIFRLLRCPFPYLWHSFYNDVKICVTSYSMYELSHQGTSCIKFLNQHNFICSKFYKLYKYNINISHNKTTGLWNNFTNLNVNNIHTKPWCGPMTSNVFKAQRVVYCQPWNIGVCWNDLVFVVELSVVIFFFSYSRCEYKNRI
jgi:hypothetical protein